jgi:TP901 family phage tail tape measure protein
MANNTRDEIIRYIFDAVGGEKVDSIGDSLKKVGEESQQTGTLFGFLEEHLGKIVTIAAAAEVALKGIEFGKESLKGAEDVEASLSRVKALASDAADQFGELDDAVEKAALAVNVSSQQSATGLAALVNQGLDAKTAIEALIPTLQLAKIANIDVSTAAAEVAESLKAFNLPASEAQTVVDQLTAASHGAAGGLSTMSNAAVQLSPDAKTLGLQFTDIVSILGLLNGKGLDTEKSVRGLRTVFQDLENPTSSLRGQLLALGDGTNDFGAAIDALTSGTPRANEALLMLNGPARTLVETLGQAGPDAIAKFSAGLEEAQGSASKTASVLDDNLRGAATRFGDAIDSIGEKLLKPVLEPFKNELNKLAGQLNDFADSPDFKEIQDAVTEMATKAAKALDDFIQGVNWKKLGDDGKATIKTLADDFSSMAKSAGDAATAINKIADTVGVGFHTLGATVDGVVALTAKATDGLITLTEKAGDLTVGGGELRKQFGEVQAVLEDVGDIAAVNAGEHLRSLGGDAVDLAGAADKAATATKAHGDAAAEAAPKVQAHAVASHEAAVAVQDIETVLPKMTLQLEQATPAAKGFAQELADGANELAVFKDKSGNVIVGTEAIKTAMLQLRLSSQQALEKSAKDFQTYFNVVDQGSANTAAGLADRQNAFLAYAKAALAASAQADEGTRATIQAQLDQKASILGVTQALADLEKQSDSSQAALVSDANRGAAALDKELEAAGRVSSSLSGDEGSVASAAQDAGDNVKDMAGGGGESLAKLGEYLQNTRSQFLSVSDAAAKAFDKRLLQDFNGEFDSTGIGFAKVIAAIGDAAKQTNDELAAQRTQLQGEIDLINGLGQASSRNFGGFGNYADSALTRMEQLSAAIQSGNYDAGLLGQQELQPLQAAIDAARQRVEALDQQFKDLVQSTQDAYDEAAGNQQALEDRRHQQALANLEAEAKAAGQYNTQTYNQAVDNENKLHAINLKNAQDQAQQQAAQQKANQQMQQAAAAGTSAEAGSPGSPSSGGGTPSGSKIDATTSVSRSGATSLGTLNINHAITVSIPAGAGLKGLSDDDIRAIANQVVSTMGPELTDTVVQQLRRGAANSI